jgi:hypothetical protein
MEDYKGIQDPLLNQMHPLSAGASSISRRLSSISRTGCTLVRSPFPNRLLICTGIPLARRMVFWLLFSIAAFCPIKQLHPPQLILQKRKDTANINVPSVSSLPTQIGQEKENLDSHLCTTPSYPCPLVTPMMSTCSSLLKTASTPTFFSKYFTAKSTLSATLPPLI